MRNYRSFSLFLVAAFAAQLAPLRAQTASPAPTMEQAIAAIKAYAPVALRQQGAPGMSIAITDADHTLAVISTGLADVATKTPVTASTRFPIGSISKSMTALSLLELHDAGRVDLNAPVQRYIPSFRIDTHGTPILVHELLSHTAGTPDDYSLANSYGYDIAMLRETHAIYKPGTQWAYSNDGFATVGQIVADVTKSTWQAAVGNAVFRPLGMTSTVAVFTPRTMEQAATGYVFRDDDLVATPPNPALVAAPPYDFVDPAGSVISTPDDMARYMRFYLRGGKAENGTQLLAPATFEAMTTPDHLANGEPAGPKGPLLEEWPDLFAHYGYGIGISGGGDGDHLIAHTGGISGYTACMQMNLTRGFGVIAMSNLVEAPLHPCAIVKYAMEVLRAQKLGQPLPAPPAGPPIGKPAIVAADYTGTYTASDTSAVIVGADQDGMFLRDRGRRYRLIVEDRDLFWTNDERFTTYYVAFERNAKKAVDGFTNGSAFYMNERYSGPRSFSHPAQWDRLAGRYDAATFSGPATLRVVIVKGRLTVDGRAPLRQQHDGTFALGDSSVRFDTLFDGKMQRLWLDGSEFYRVELP